MPVAAAGASKPERQIVAAATPFAGLDAIMDWPARLTYTRILSSEPGNCIAARNAAVTAAVRSGSRAIASAVPRFDRPDNSQE